MPATVTGSKTLTQDASPNLNAALLSTILATAPENLTVAQLAQLHSALATVSGDNPAATVGSLLS
jgi:hypothetical protein